MDSSKVDWRARGDYEKICRQKMRPVYLMYSGCSEDVRGDPKFRGATHDKSRAKEFLKNIDPLGYGYCFGRVTVVTETDEYHIDRLSSAWEWERFPESEGSDEV